MSLMLATVPDSLLTARREPVPTRADAARELLARRRARRDFLAFMAYTWRTPAAPLLVGRHTQAIAARLDRALDDLQRGQSSYLLITVPFRHGKSDQASRFFPPYALGRDPNLEIILATYGAALSEELSRDARSVLRSDEYSRLFPAVELDPENSAASTWGVRGHRGKLRAVGIEGPATGKGADILVIDDYFKTRAEAESETIRNSVWDAVTNNLMTRLAPAHIVLILATRWHVDDVSGRVLARSGKDGFPTFEPLHFRAREPRASTAPADGGADFDYLFPERFPAEWYERQFATLGGYAAAALLQGEPTIRGGNMLKIDRVQFADEMPEGLLWVRFWDLASTEKERAKDDPDRTAGGRLAVALDAHGAPTLYIDDFRWCREEAAKRDALIERTAREDGPGCWQAVEAVAGYKDAFTTLKRLLDGFSVVHGVTYSKDKVVRAGEVEPLFESGRVVMRRAWWNDEVLREMGEFPNGAHDDLVDPVTGGFALALQRASLASQFGGRAGRGAV